MTYFFFIFIYFSNIAISEFDDLEDTEKVEQILKGCNKIFGKVSKSTLMNDNVI